MYKRAFLIFLLIFVFCTLLGCSIIKQDGEDNNKPPTAVVPNPGTIPAEEKDPVKEQMKSMGIEDKIGQLLIVGLEGLAMNEQERLMIESNHIGGFILYGSNIESPSQLLSLTNSLRLTNSVNKIPLFISVDEEGGRISRIPKEIKNISSNKVIGRINNEEFSYELGELLGEKVKAFGFNMDYAPVLDINSNPKNPVIGDRAFGAEEKVVSKLGIQTMKGIQAAGIIPVIKHFPGHGDTSVDSHVGLPSVNNDIERLKSFELIPFAKAIDAGTDVVMVAHILLPKIDKENPATLSKTIISNLLREQMGYNGVVITDDLTMGAIAENYDLGSAAIKSVVAGSDIMLVAHGYDNAMTVLNSLKEAVAGGVITEERINESVYRILQLKQKYNLKDEEAEVPDIAELNNRIVKVLDSYMKK